LEIVNMIAQILVSITTAWVLITLMFFTKKVNAKTNTPSQAAKRARRLNRRRLMEISQGKMRRVLRMINGYIWEFREMCRAYAIPSRVSSLVEILVFYGSFFVYYLGNLGMFYYMPWISFPSLTDNMVDNGPIRSAMKSCEIKKVNLPSNHSHPGSAANRTQAEKFIQRVALETGRDVYSVSMSTRDQREGMRGSHNYHYAKDLLAPVQNDLLKPTDIMKMIDVDYYVQPSEIVCMNPMFIYTIVPEKLQENQKEYLFDINRESELVQRVSGGATYRHRLWNYDTDVLTNFSFRPIILQWCGMSIKIPLIPTLVLANVDVRRLGEHRYVYLIAPGRICAGLKAFYYAWKFNTKPLVRKDYLSVNGLSLRMDMNVDGDVQTYIRRADLTHPQIQITPKAMASVMTRIKELGDKKTISSIQRVLSSENIDDAPFVASELYDLWEDLVEESEVVVRPVDDTPDYQPVYSEIPFEDCKSIGQTIGQAFYDNCWAPRAGFSTDVSYVQERIEKPKSNVRSLPPFLEQCMQEFTRHLIPEPHQGVPVGEEVVLERQSRPTQKAGFARIHNAEFVKDPMGVQSFTKAECYGKPCGARGISNVETEHKFHYSQFMYAFTDDVLKRQSWYAFGKTPKELANYLVSFVCGARTLLPTDFSRFDGSLSEALRKIEEYCLKRFFHPIYHNNVMSLYKAQFNIKGTTKFGLNYDVGSSRLSGSAETAAFNSVINACVAYLAYRKSGLSPNDAWRKLGAYGGDDGLNPDLSVKDYKFVCDKVGLVFKGDLVCDGPVNFLGRTFHNLWISSGSTLDFKRAISKLHWSAHKDATPQMCASRKAISILATDNNTPFFTCWAKQVIKIVGKPAELDKTNRCEDYSWWFREFGDNACWPEPLHIEEVYQHIAQEMTCTVKHLTDLEEKIKQAKAYEDLWLKDYFVKPEVKGDGVAVERRGEILAGPIKPAGNTIKKPFRKQPFQKLTHGKVARYSHQPYARTRAHSTKTK
jgi:hypothetical protein